MAKKPKSNNNNMSLKKEATHWTDEYTDIFTMKTIPIDDIYLIRLGHDFLKWAMTDKKALKVYPFFRKKGIARGSVLRFAARCSEFNTLLSEGKAEIGDRREIGGLTRKLDSSLVARTMNRYDPDWKESDEFHAEIRKQDNPHAATLLAWGALPQTIPHSELVPNRKKLMESDDTNNT